MWWGDSVVLSATWSALNRAASIVVSTNANDVLQCSRTPRVALFEPRAGLCCRAPGELSSVRDTGPCNDLRRLPIHQVLLSRVSAGALVRRGLRVCALCRPAVVPRFTVVRCRLTMRLLHVWLAETVDGHLGPNCNRNTRLCAKRCSIG